MAASSSFGVPNQAPTRLNFRKIGSAKQAAYRTPT